MSESEHTDEKDLDGGKTTPTMKNNLRRGVEFFNSKRYEQAILEWSKVLREDPTNRKALDFIQKARTRLSKTATPEENSKLSQNADQCFQTGRQYFEEEEYQMAINQWIRALTYQPDHLDALNYIRKAQSRIEDGAAPTKAKPGAPAPVVAKALKESESGSFSREEIKPAATPAGAPKPKVKEEDNKRLAAEAEALYEEILSSPATGGGASTAVKKPGFSQVKAGPGGKKAAPAARREPGIIGQLISFPARHPLWLLGILVIAAAVFATLWFINRGVDWVKEKNDGIATLGQKQCFEAAQHFTNVIKAKADDVDAWTYRGQCYTCQKDWDKAIPDLKKATELDPKNKKAYYLLALSQYNKNQFDEARNSLRKARDNGKMDNEAVNLMTEILSSVGKLDELLKEFPDLQVKDMPAEVMVVVGRAALNEQRLEDALKMAELGTEKAPTEEDPWVLRVTVLEQMGRFPDAVQVANEAIGKLAATLSPKVHYKKANIQLKMGDSEGAIATMREAESQGGDYRYHMELGNIWMLLFRKEKRADFKEKAVASFDKAASMATDGTVSLAWGRALLTFGDKVAARQKLLEAAENFNVKSVDEMGYSLQWICYYLLEDWDKALISVGGALAANQTPIANNVARGITLVKKGDTAGARESFEAGKKSAAPIEYADLSSADIKAMMAGVGL